MLEDPPKDLNESALLALARSLGEIRDGLVTLSLLLQDALFELETERSVSESTRDQVNDAGDQRQPGKQVDPPKNQGMGAS